MKPQSNDIPPWLRRIMFPLAPKPPSYRDRYAGYHEHVLASCIDMALLFFLLYDPFMWFSAWVYGQQHPSLDAASHMSWSDMRAIYVGDGLIPRIAWVYVVQLGIIGSLLILCQHKLGYTPGRWVMGIALVDARTEQPPTAWQLLRRFLGYFISLPPFMLGYIWSSWDPKRQTWHDKIAGTVLLNARARGWYWRKVKYGLLWVFARLRGRPAPEPIPEPPLIPRADDTMPVANDNTAQNNDTPQA